MSQMRVICITRGNTGLNGVSGYGQSQTPASRLLGRILSGSGSHNIWLARKPEAGLAVCPERLLDLQGLLQSEAVTGLFREQNFLFFTRGFVQNVLAQF